MNREHMLSNMNFCLYQDVICTFHQYKHLQDGVICLSNNPDRLLGSPLTEPALTNSTADVMQL